MKFITYAVLITAITPFAAFTMQAPIERSAADALLKAVHGGNAQEVAELIKKSPNPKELVNLMPSAGMAILREAALSNNVAIVNSLLDAGAEVDAKDSYNLTPLMMAALNGNKDAMITLIRRGANVNAKDAGGQSVLNYVQFGGATNAQQKAELTKILTDAGAR